MSNEEVIKQAFEKTIPFNQFLGFEIEEIQAGLVRMRIPFRPEFVGEVRANRLHGGLILTAMDAVGGAAASTTIDLRKDMIATIDLRTDFMNPGQAQDVIVEAKVSKSGTRIIFVSMSAYHPGAKDQLIAEGRCTYSVKRSPKEPL